MVKRGEEKKAKAAAKESKITHGKGVMAKIAATDRMCKEFKTAAKAMLAEGTKRIRKGIAQQMSSIKVQKQENADAAANMDAGIKGVIASSIKMSARMRKEAKELVSKGVQELNAGVQEINKGISEKGAGINAQAKENNAYVKDFYYG